MNLLIIICNFDNGFKIIYYKKKTIFERIPTALDFRISKILGRTVSYFVYCILRTSLPKKKITPARWVCLNPFL